MRILETKDKTGRTIYLTDERWKHISSEHPEVVPYLNHLTETLLHPAKMTSPVFDDKMRHYYNYFKDRQRYLLAIVKYLNGEGFIITAYFMRKIQ